MVVGLHEVGGRARVLVVDDDQRTREGMRELLVDEGYVVEVARDGTEALERLESFQPDLVLSDVCMPGTDGFDLAKQLRRSKLSDTALILVSALHDRDRCIRALEVGADDFVAKPVDPGELVARVRAHLRRARRHSHVLRMSIVDELTSALNRRGLFETLERELEKARENGTPLSILIADVDDFKQVNDTFGHAAGDDVLKRVADLLRQNVRTRDAVARIGGDELVVVLPRSDAWDAAAVAARIRSVDGPGNTRVTLSVGAATLHEDESLDELLARADANMYAAKAASRERSVTPVATTYIQVHGRKGR